MRFKRILACFLVVAVVAAIVGGIALLAMHYSQPFAASSSSSSPFPSIYDPEHIRENLLSDDSDRQRTGLLTAFYRSHSLAPNEVDALVQFMCTKSVANSDDRKVLMRVCREGSISIEAALVAQAASCIESLQKGQACPCSAGGLSLMLETLCSIDAKYKDAGWDSGSPGVFGNVSVESLKSTAKTRGVPFP